MSEIKEFNIWEHYFNKNSTPFKEIIKGEDVSHFVLNLLNGNHIRLKDVFRLKINVKKVGVIFLLIPLNGFDRQKAIEAITPLKDIEVVDYSTASIKVNRLIQVTKDLNPLLVLYIADDNSLLPNDAFSSLEWGVYTLCHNETATIAPASTIQEIELSNETSQTSSLSPEISELVSRGNYSEALRIVKTPEEKEIVVKMFLQLSHTGEAAPSASVHPAIDNHDIKPVNKPKEKPAPKEKKDLSFKNCWSSFMGFCKLTSSIMKKHGFYYLFMFIALLLVGFTVSVGVYNCYYGKMICIFFFVCALVGGTLYYFVSFDHYKLAKVNTYPFYLSVFFSLLGMGMSLLGFYVFYILQKEKPESLTNPGVVYGITIGATLFVGLVANIIAYFVRKKKSK